VSRPALAKRAQRLYRDAVVVDAHNDVVTKVLDDGYDLDVRHAAGFGPGEGQTDLPRLVESGITAQFLAAWVDAPYALERPGAAFARALRYFDAIDDFVGRHPDRLVLGTDAASVRRAKREGRLAIFVGVEGGHAIEGSLDRLRELRRRGARYLTLTWNNGNDWAGSSIGVGDTRTGGLTDFGRDVVRELERLGMLVDLSHVSDETFDDALAVASGPVVVTHSCAQALCDHPRNLTDDQLRAVAGSGGVVGVNFYARFLDRAFLAAAVGRGAAAAAAAAVADSPPLPVVPLARLAEHVEHVARVAGVDHVALGSDFDGVSALPAGMEDVTCLPRLAELLLERGFGDDDLRKFLGENMLRVMDAAFSGA